MPRIYELGGKLPKSMIDFHNVSACPPAFVPADPTNQGHAANPRRSRALRGARLYRDLQYDARQGSPHLLSLAILHEEIQHEAWFSEFIGEGPSEHAQNGLLY